MLINIELYAYMYRNTVNVQCHGRNLCNFLFFQNQFATFDYVGQMSKSALCNLVGRLK